MEKKDRIKIFLIFIVLFIGLVIVIRNADIIDNSNIIKHHEVKTESVLEGVSEN